jgi:hypothetical protein
MELKKIKYVPLKLMSHHQNRQLKLARGYLSGFVKLKGSNNLF